MLFVVWLVLGFVFPSCPPPEIPVAFCCVSPLPISQWSCSMAAALGQLIKPEVADGFPWPKGSQRGPCGSWGQMLPVTRLLQWH